MSLGVFSLVTVTACGLDLKDAVRIDDWSEAVILASEAQIKSIEVLEGSYIVAFRGDVGSTHRRFASYLTEYQYHYQPLAETYLTDPRVKDIQYITGVDLANPKDAKEEEQLAPPPALRLAWDEDSVSEVPAVLTRVDFATAQDAEAVLREWHAAGRIWFAEPNHASKLDQDAGEADAGADTGGADTGADGGGATGGNPFAGLAEQYVAWWHGTIKLPTALEALAAKDLPEANIPVIAVLDSGVDVSHPALEGRIWVNSKPGESGCPGDINGCDTTQAKKGQVGVGAINPYLTSAAGEPCPETSEGGVCAHGTHVTGIIASRADATAGVGGVCPVCQVMPIKIIQNVKGVGRALDSAILNGFKYLTLFRDKQNIVRVANSSFGQYVRARSIGLLVSILKKAPNEVLVVGAAGNDDSMARQYPAAFNDAIAVAAVGLEKGKAGYSNFGPWVDIAAPGGDAPNYPQILSTVPGGTYGDKQGTSMATPVVAGVAGLILAADPGRGFRSLRNSLIKTADPILYDAATAGGFNRTYYYPKVGGESSPRPLLGAGIVDAPAAIENTANTGRLVSNLSRVSRGCSVIDARHPELEWADARHPQRSEGPPLMLLLLLFPFVFVCSHHFFKRRQGYSAWRP